MKKTIKKVKLFPNNNKKSQKIAHSLKVKLLKKGYILDNQNYDLAIAIGGDGSFLRMVKDCNFNSEIYYIGINVGTLGFAQEIYPENIDLFLQKLKRNNYKIENIGIEETKVKTKEQEYKFYSLNEILIR